MAKKIRIVLTLQLPAGKATPAPPVGTALGPHGINIVEFTKSYNEKTADKSGQIIPAQITIFEDRSFSFILKTPPAADLIGAGPEGLLGLVALGEDDDPDDLAGAVRQDDRAADHLVGVAGIDAEAEMSLDRRVEGDEVRLLGQRRRLGRRVDPVAVDELHRLEILLAVCHVVFLSAAGSSDLPLWCATRGRGNPRMRDLT